MFDCNYNYTRPSVWLTIEPDRSSCQRGVSPTTQEHNQEKMGWGLGRWIYVGGEVDCRDYPSIFGMVEPPHKYGNWFGWESLDWAMRVCGSSPVVDLLTIIINSVFVLINNFLNDLDISTNPDKTSKPENLACCRPMKQHFKRFAVHKEADRYNAVPS